MSFCFSSLAMSLFDTYIYIYICVCCLFGTGHSKCAQFLVMFFALSRRKAPGQGLCVRFQIVRLHPSARVLLSSSLPFCSFPLTSFSCPALCDVLPCLCLSSIALLSDAFSATLPVHTTLGRRHSNCTRIPGQFPRESSWT